MLTHCLELFAIQAVIDTIKPIYSNIQKQVLADLQLVPDPDPKRDEMYARRGLEVPKVLLTDGDLYFLNWSAAIEEDPSYNPMSQAARYHSEMDRRLRNAGLTNGASCVCMAENFRIKAQQKLMHEALQQPSVAALLKDSPDPNTWMLEHQKQFIEIQLKWCAPYLDEIPERKRLQDQIFVDFGGPKSATM